MGRHSQGLVIGCPAGDLGETEAEEDQSQCTPGGQLHLIALSLSLPLSLRPLPPLSSTASTPLCKASLNKIASVSL